MKGSLIETNWRHKERKDQLFFPNEGQPQLCGCRHAEIRLVAGMSPAYWAAFPSWDYASFITPIGLDSYLICDCRAYRRVLLLYIVAALEKQGRSQL